jgi:predicted ATP-dependent endonuclease of OLD family
MKVQSVQLKYFKRFNEKTLDFTDSETGLAKNLIVLLGMNGSGKTTVLQAIAALLGQATGRLETVADLNWPGFNLQLASNHWLMPPQIEIQLEFSKPENQAIDEMRPKMSTESASARSNKRFVTLRLSENQATTDTPEELCQFQGRNYAKQIVKFHPDGHRIFERVGTVFWYTEQRTTTSLTTEKTAQPIEISDNILRDRLSKFALFHQQLETKTLKARRPGQKDLFVELQKAYQTVFPERRFEGPSLRQDIDDVLSEPLFYLFDGQYPYEVSEMSGGERAIFPILFDFANWNIHNSVILIDEIELHLHPPMQQAFLHALPRLGQNNQFIITTHSDYIEQLVSTESIIRLED